MSIKGQMTWEPLWKNETIKIASREEAAAIDRFKKSLKVTDAVIETILDEKGQKNIRIKKKYDVEDGIEMFDYFIYGPLVFKGTKIFCRQKYDIGQTVNSKKVLQNITLMLDEQVFIEQIKKDMFDRAAIREAEEKQKILSKLWSK